MPYIGRSTDGFGGRNRFIYLASSGDTSVSGADANGATLTFTDGAYVDVYLNGVLLKPTTDYNTSTANTIAGLSALNTNDEVTVVVYDVFTVADMVSATSGGTFSGNVTFGGNVSGLDVNGTELILDADADTSITADTDDQIDIKIGGTDEVTLSSSGIVINEGSNDRDFRIESNGLTHALFVDGGNDSVLIGMDDVAYAVTNEADNLIVGNPSDALTGITLVTSASGYSSINFSDANSGNGRIAAYMAYDHNDDQWVFGGQGSGNTLFKIHDNGRWEQFNCNTTSVALHIKNDGNNTNRKGMIIQCGTDDNSGTNTALSFDDGDGSGQGSITFSGGTVSYGAFTAHHEISLPNADKTNGYDYGTLVEIDEVYYAKNRNGTEQSRGIRYLVKKSSGAYSKKVLGAYCGDMPEQADEDGTYKDNLHQAAVLGDGHIICNGEKGNISVGDGITTSSTAGVGMKADKLCMIVGIAQEDVTFSSASETKLVPVQYGVRQFTPWTD